MRYLILSHIRGDKPGCYAETEVQAVSDEEAERKFDQFLEDRASIDDESLKHVDRTMFVRVIRGR